MLFEGTEAPAQLHVPVAEIFHLAVLGGAQVAGVGAHHADEMLGIADVVGAEIETHAHPFVRVEDEGIGALHTLPVMAALR